MATFGYSVGDALTAIVIITRIIQTLRDTKESRSEYQHLLSDLNNLKLVFEELERFKSTADSAIERSNKNAIRGLASEYGRNLQELLDRVSKFDQSLGARSIAGVFRDFQRKTQWAFFVKEEVPTWRGQITVMIVTIQLLVQMHTSLATQQQAVALAGTSKDIKAIPGLLRNGQDRVSEEMLECRRAIDVFQQETREVACQNTDRILNTLSGFSHRIDEIKFVCEHGARKLDISDIIPDRDSKDPLSGQLSRVAEDTANRLVVRMLSEYGRVTPEMLTFINKAFQENLDVYKYLRHKEDEKDGQIIRNAPSLLLDDNFHLVDGLGRQHSLPYEFFKDWLVFQAYLRCRFANVPGERKVIDQQYHILPQRQLTRSIGPKDWQSHVFPKSRFVMSMIIRHVNRRGKTCPRPFCDYVQIEGSGPEPDMITCPKCNLNCRPSRTDADPSPTLKTDTVSQTMVPIAKSESDAYEEELRELGVFNMVDICEALILAATVNPVKETSTSKPAFSVSSEGISKCLHSPCDYTTKPGVDMYHHMKTMHPSYSQAVFDCLSHDCDKKFKRKDNLTKHRRNMHREDLFEWYLTSEPLIWVGIRRPYYRDVPPSRPPVESTSTVQHSLESMRFYT